MERDRGGDPVSHRLRSRSRSDRVFQSLVAFEHRGDAKALAVVRLLHAQDPRFAANPHIFLHGLALWHGEDQFQFRAFGDPVAEVHEDATLTDVARMARQFFAGAVVAFLHRDRHLGLDTLLATQFRLGFSRHGFPRANCD